MIAEPGGNKGQINYFFRTRSWEKQTMPAGSFDAIRVDAHDDPRRLHAVSQRDQLQLHLLVLAGGARHGARAALRRNTRRLGDIQAGCPCSTCSTSSRASRPGK